MLEPAFFSGTIYYSRSYVLLLSFISYHVISCYISSIITPYHSAYLYMYIYRYIYKCIYIPHNVMILFVDILILLAYSYCWQTYLSLCCVIMFLLPHIGIHVHIAILPHIGIHVHIAISILIASKYICRYITSFFSYYHSTYLPLCCVILFILLHH